MPLYNDLRPPADFDGDKDYELVFPSMTAAEKKRAIQNLLVLRQGLTGNVTARRADNNLIVASWNIAQFGHTTQRLPEAFLYIAEILSRFDLIAVQEVKTGLNDLYKVMKLLGPKWHYIINDITEGDDGNSERSAYIFNTERVQFAGLAGEIVIWDELVQLTGVQHVTQLKRTPYITGFTAGWKTFAMVNVHLNPRSGDVDVTIRQEELKLLLSALKDKISHEHMWNENIILVGDFNFYENKDDTTIQLIESEGFKEVEGLKGKDTNASETERYDRMFLTSNNNYFTLGQTAGGMENGGVFDPFDFVYKTGQEMLYQAEMKDDYTGHARNLDDPDDLAAYFHHPWRKNQLSDHYPIWIELIVDSSDLFLQDRLAGFP